jgi:demethylmenaquinone methyltransferase/2-methoxy-6-polyprenyl-1,4-benzoquinol methylase
VNAPGRNQPSPSDSVQRIGAASSTGPASYTEPASGKETSSLPDSAQRSARYPTDTTYLRDLFSASARYYEWVNLVTSMGQVVLWRREVIRVARLRPTDKVLDAFCGPGGLAEHALPQLGEGGRLVLADLSPVMLREAQMRLERVRAGQRGSGQRSSGQKRAALRGPGQRGVAREDFGAEVDYVAGDLLHDELGLREFDVVLLGWGLRYVEDVPAALARMRTFLRPEGRLVILEFTRPRSISWATPAHVYFRYILPRVGSLLAQDRELHEYLQVSSAGFLSATELVRAVEDTGFAMIHRRTYLDGLVTILVGVPKGVG